MPNLVVDSSVVVKWVLPESDSSIADAVNNDTTRNGGAFFAVDISIAEVANAIWKQQHRGLVTKSQAFQFLAKLQACPLQLIPTGQFLHPAMDIATRYRIAVYDALFVALADAMGLVGVTADVPLHKAVHADYPRITLLRDWPQATP